MIQVRFGSLVTRTRGVVFDKDNTLVRAEGFWRYLAAARGAGVAALAGPQVRAEWDEIMGIKDGRIDPDRLLGLGTLEEEVAVTAGLLSWRLDWPWLRASQEAARLIAEADAGWNPAKSDPVPGFPGVLHRLAGAGLLLGVATSDHRERALATLESFGVTDLVQVVVTPEDVPRPKPAPDMLLRIAGEFGVDPSHLVMVGDAPVDMAMARAVGAVAVGVTVDPERVPLLKEAGAACVIADLTEIVLI